ncbi:MAG: mechanosensitive ion channel family protein, partial [Rhodoplanes sp.]
LLASLQQGFETVMKTEWKVGAAVFSVRDFVMFFLVLFASYLVSRVLRLMLAEEIFPRFQLRRGVPDALVLLARYGVLLFGFLFALSSAGVDLSKVTIALSALGVGIGFGLQNVVNNFVCGLVLVFEHPIQVGDYIEVGPHYGQVTRIGFRSSMVLTQQGSEVVIPNAELIGNKVVNWSMSDAIRRVSIPVPVSFGTDTPRVIELLQSVAGANPLVRADPPPKAVLEQFGDNALRFVLNCWVRTEQMGSVRDELTLAIDQGLRDAGIGTPFQQIRIARPQSFAPGAKA